MTPKRKSGVAWVSEFRDSKLISDLIPGFRTNVEAFLTAMTTARIPYPQINSTLRPLERAYLMHYSFKIANGTIAAAIVPQMSGVDIDWVHSTDAASIQAARDMVAAYKIAHEPALHSRHTEGRAIDMNISWSGDITIRFKNGKAKTIFNTPHTGENKTLQKVGESYGVVHARGFTDPPHWSDDGSY